MTMIIKRWKFLPGRFESDDGIAHVILKSDSAGPWVEFEDHERVVAENDRLAAALEEIAGSTAQAFGLSPYNKNRHRDAVEIAENALSNTPRVYKGNTGPR